MQAMEIMTGPGGTSFHSHDAPEFLQAVWMMQWIRHHSHRSHWLRLLPALLPYSVRMPSLGLRTMIQQDHALDRILGECVRRCSPQGMVDR